MCCMPNVWIRDNVTKLCQLLPQKCIKVELHHLTVISVEICHEQRYRWAERRGLRSPLKIYDSGRICGRVMEEDVKLWISLRWKVYWGPIREMCLAYDGRDSLKSVSWAAIRNFKRPHTVRGISAEVTGKIATDENDERRKIEVSSWAP